MSIWDRSRNFAYDEPLDPGDEWLVALNEARGDYSGERSCCGSLGSASSSARCATRRQARASS
jgi:hypothetical protein